MRSASALMGYVFDRSLTSIPNFESIFASNARSLARMPWSCSETTQLVTPSWELFDPRDSISTVVAASFSSAVNGLCSRNAGGSAISMTSPCPFSVSPSIAHQCQAEKRLNDGWKGPRIQPTGPGTIDCRAPSTCDACRSRHATVRNRESILPELTSKSRNCLQAFCMACGACMWWLFGSTNERASELGTGP